MHIKTSSMHHRLGSTTPSQLAFPGEGNPEFPVGRIPLGQYKCKQVLFFFILSVNVKIAIQKCCIILSSLSICLLTICSLTFSNKKKKSVNTFVLCQGVQELVSPVPMWDIRYWWPANDSSAKSQSAAWPAWKNEEFQIRSKTNGAFD